ncbi:ribonuclease P protein component [Candidatus Sororendozoicomonas aggregata]|uniref:ribonuclease P protein component n=1 Tax=Candidatus Sororendozoicomonas aggregata TaxID=3073239 RepID=UPI002ED5D3F0
MGFYFGRDKRLCTAAEFKKVFDKTDIKVSSRHLLILARVNGQDTSRLGLVVAKKNVRLAVSRNRTKRHIRESFRHHTVALSNLDIVVLVRRGFSELADKEMNQLLKKQWLKLSQRLTLWKASRQDFHR